MSFKNESAYFKGSSCSLSSVREIVQGLRDWKDLTAALR